jgi:hypothetical protein
MERYEHILLTDIFFQFKKPHEEEADGLLIPKNPLPEDE